MVSHILPMPAPVLPKREREPARTAVAGAAAPATDQFVAAMLETPFSVHKHQNPLDWAVSLVLHILIIGTVLMIPLYYTEVIDLRGFTKTFLVGPPPPPPPAPPAMEKIVRAAPKVRLLQSGRLISPVAIPREIAMLKEAPLPPDTSGDGVIGGVPGGIPGGQAGGVLGGIIGGSGSKIITATPLPPAPVKRIVRVGGQIKPPRLLSKTEVVYPTLARATKVEGTVTIEAVIDEQGDVVQARVVSGPALLIQAALQEVTKWKYEPTLLNGQPVSIQMIVYVNYHLY